MKPATRRGVATELFFGQFTEKGFPTSPVVVSEQITLTNHYFHHDLPVSLHCIELTPFNQLNRSVADANLATKRYIKVCSGAGWAGRGVDVT